MKVFLRVLSYVFTAVVAAVAALSIFLFSVNFFDREDQSKLDQLDEIIDNYFIGEYDQTEMEDAAAHAMVSQLGDRWSYYIPASDFQSYSEQMSNAYVGIGVIVTPEESGRGVLIQQVYEEGPAWKAGLRPGDLLIRVGEENLSGRTVDEVAELVRGPVDSDISLTVIREEKELNFAFKRGTIEVDVARGAMLDGRIGFIKIRNFDKRCAEETIAAVEELLEQGAESLIFDVRDNPGGYKDEMVKVLDYLLPEGPLFRSEDYAGKTQTDYSDAACLDIPMAVLVNENSYSAAEFFAAALRDYDAASVVGNQTCGKGYFQYTFKLNDGSAVGLSVGKYFTPEGVSLAGVGLTPDFTVEVDEQTLAGIQSGMLEFENDPQIAKAAAVLRGE